MSQIALQMEPFRTKVKGLHCPHPQLAALMLDDTITAYQLGRRVPSLLPSGDGIRRLIYASRAWDRMWPEHEKKMHYPYPGNYGMDAASGRFFHYSGNPMGLREYPPMTTTQFTGLRDRNGKDIYEGDIVNMSVDDQPHPCEVWFRDCSWWAGT